MKPYRKQKLASVLRDVIAEAVHHRVQDPRIDPLTTITRVEMSGDLLIAKVFLTVSGGEVQERQTLQAIRHAGGYIQRLVAREVSLRLCPELRFEIDERAKKVQVTLDILAENRRERGELDDEHEDADGEADPGSDELPQADDDENAQRSQE